MRTTPRPDPRANNPTRVVRTPVRIGVAEDVVVGDVIVIGDDAAYEILTVEQPEAGTDLMHFTVRHGVIEYPWATSRSFLVWIKTGELFAKRVLEARGPDPR